jgi:hypothetical protein
MANEAYILEGTAKKVQNHDTPDAVWTVEGLANAAGRISGQIDLGASPRPGFYMWQCEVQFQATPTQGKGLELYKSGALNGSNTRTDGDIGTSDAALGDVDIRRNLKMIGYVVSENAAANEKCIASGVFGHTQRYITLVAYNDSGAAVHATSANFIFRLIPLSWQGQ